jgi:hypothetical protein
MSYERANHKLGDLLPQKREYGHGGQTSPQHEYEDESQVGAGTPLFGAMADGEPNKRRRIFDEGSRMSSALLSPSKDVTQACSQQTPRNVFDTSYYVRHMLASEESAPSPYHQFKKVPWLSIKDLQAKSKHL